MSIIKEFKQFAVKGNAVDMAVGIIIGAGFGKIVNSLVADVIMPPIGVLLGGKWFSEYKYVLVDGEISATGEVIKEAITLNWWIFIQTIFDFLLIAFSVFLLVKIINRLKKKEERRKTKLTYDQELLTEIRDLLKKRGQ